MAQPAQGGAEAAAGMAPVTAGAERREIKVVGFLGISDYGLGQFEVLCSRYRVAFATAKRKPAAHAQGLDAQLAKACALHGVEYLGSVNANSEEIVERARQTDLVVIGGYDAILHGPILTAPRYGVINTHLGVLPLNRGCCPTLWAQLHDLPQGYTTYQVGLEVDFGSTLDLYTAEPGLGCLRDTNRAVYDALAAQAVARFGAALDRLETGESLRPCGGDEAYHRKGMPNDGWLSFHWSNAFLHRFSLALDFAPYLPGRTRIMASQEAPDEPEQELSLAVEAVESPGPAAGVVGEVLEAEGEELVVRTREGTARCRLRAGPLPARGAVLASGRPGGAAAHAHAVDADFAGAVLPLERYRCARQT